MTRLPDISNQKINNTRAMEALAKGEKMDELKPCPFCGSSNTTLDYYEISCPQELGTIVVCNDCGASAKSIVDWNTRPIEDALAKGDEMKSFVPDELWDERMRLMSAQPIEAIDAWTKAAKMVSELKIQLASRDALIERLIEAGEKACRDYEGFGYGIDNIFLTDKYIKPKSLPLEFNQDEFEDIVSEWKASKDGGAE